MALRTTYSNNPEKAQLQRKADQEDEMASLALRDGDRKDAGARFKKAQELREQARLLDD